MHIRRWLSDPRATRVLAHARELGHSRRLHRALWIVAAMLVLFGLLGFLAAPPILRTQIEQRAGAALGRPVTLGAVHLNPFTLRLQLDRLHVADRDGSAFIDADQAVINASWTSLFHLAPVLDELRVVRPRLKLVRDADGRFNFTDIIERNATKPGTAPASPARFALANIRVQDGDIAFDDRLTGASHRIEQLEVGIPFLANLPADTDIFVQPLLSMRIDGSALHVEGRTKPFADARESTVHFRFDRLDLPRYLAYVPTPLPVMLPRGWLSGTLDVHFVQAQPAPELMLTGRLQLDEFALATREGAPILQLGHADAQLDDVQPLLSRYRFGAIALDRARLNYALLPGGRSNFDAWTAGPAPSATANATPATDLRIANLTLSDSAVRYADADAHALDLTRMHGTLRGISLLPAPPGSFDLEAGLGGGELATRGTLDLAKGVLKGTLDIRHVAVAPLQAVAAPMLRANIQRGTLDAGGTLQMSWQPTFNVQLSNARIAVADFAMASAAKSPQPAASWKQLDAAIPSFDLAGRQARLGAVSLHGPSIDTQRRRDGSLDLVDLLPSTPAKPTHAPTAPTPSWHWSIARLALDDGAVALTDHAGARPATLKLGALKAHIDELDDRLDQARPFAVEGRLERGSFRAEGTLRPMPLGADLALVTQRLDLARFVPYLDVPLNVVIASAQLSSDGKLHYDGRGREPTLRYRGQATLEHVRVQDKLTGDDFLRWRTLGIARLDAAIGTDAPRVHIGELVLTSFYARMIVNASGRLNLADVVASPAAAPVSVTRAEGNAPSAAPVSSSSTKSVQAASAPPSLAPAADIHLGGITLVNGQLNYTDDFIKPNYTANLTRLTGKIGAFGTTPGEPPAELALQAALDDDSPVDISGSINPLQPVAFLDIQGKADEVQLDRLTAYSTRYTGYPITAGKLHADVHYRLDQRKLDADNHIFITQLTFGERDESPGVQHLPVKLAVALLKDTDGNIDVNLPVSGSLDDPQFSVGGLVWRAIGNLIVKAVTAPFRLLGAAFGGRDAEQLGYVEFAPGSAVLDAGMQDRLGKLVAVLAKKPSLKLDIIGRVDPTKDREGLRKVTVDHLIRRELVLDEQGKDADVSDAALAKVQVTPDQYEKYLRRAYKHDDIPDKPHNVLGLKKSLEPDEMRGLMEADVAVDEAAMRALAQRRADAVRSWLAGKLDAARYAEKPVLLDAQGIDDKGKTTRVDFGLHQ